MAEAMMLRSWLPGLQMGRNLGFTTKFASSEPDTIAPDGSEVRVLCSLRGGSMALFSIAPGAISKPVAHRTVEEIWCFISGTGRIWRRLGDLEEITEIGPGASITLPAGTWFQFRNDGSEPLTAVGATMPPWPGEGEAYPVPGKWAPSE